MQNLDLAKKNVIITGANGGIGIEIAKQFLKEGSTIILPYRNNRNQIDLLIEQYGEDRVHAYKLDLNDMTQIDTFVYQVREKFNRIDVLVNNAGITDPSPLEEFSEVQWDMMLNINLKGPFFLVQKLFPVMKEAGGGSVVNIGSWSGHEPAPGMGAYSISKAGLIMMTKLMAIEWAPFNIRVNDVSPGLIRTPISERFYQNEEILNDRTNFVPLHRIGRGQDIATMVTFLCSDQASYITGQSIVIDGGLVNSIHAHLAGPPKEQMKRNKQFRSQNV